jgi:hypothetical protein
MGAGAPTALAFMGIRRDVSTIASHHRAITEDGQSLRSALSALDIRADAEQMSVVVQFVSVVVRRAAVERGYPGGISQFERDVPNRTFCADRHLVRVGFMSSTDADDFIGQLAINGLQSCPNGKGDICVVDHLSGPETVCPWLRFEAHDDGLGGRCWWAGDEPGELAIPAVRRVQTARTES